MRVVKVSGPFSYTSGAMSQRSSDPAGYLTDAERALEFSLIDHVFVGGSYPPREPNLQSPDPLVLCGD